MVAVQQELTHQLNRSVAEPMVHSQVLIPKVGWTEQILIVLDRYLAGLKHEIGRLGLDLKIH